MDWQPPRSTLPPLDEQRLATAWTEYEEALSRLPGTPAQRMATLHGLLADVSARLESEQRALVSRTLLEYTSEIDRPVTRSTPTGVPSRPDRGDRASSPLPPAWERSPAAQRLGARLAQKLVLATVRGRRDSGR